MPTSNVPKNTKTAPPKHHIAHADSLRVVVAVTAASGLTLVVAWLPVAFKDVEVPHALWGDGLLGWAWIPLLFALAAIARFFEVRLRQHHWINSWLSVSFFVLAIGCFVGLFFE